jgi:signal transduction histidine kinase
MTADRTIREDAGVDGPPQHPRASDGSSSGGRRSDRAEFWTRSLRAWDLAFVALIAIVALMSVVSGATAAGMALSLGALAAIVVGYLVLARPGAVRGDGRRTAAYLAILVVATAVQVPAVQLGAVLLFVSFSHIWFFASSRLAGTLWSVALSASVVFGELVAEGLDPAALPELAGSMAIALVFSIGLGLWITTISERSEDRAKLLEQLRATQDELAISHHSAGVMAERERMSREIHDTLAQGFTSVIMLSQTAAADLRRDLPDKAAERLALIERTARENLAEARALVAASAPVGLEGSSLTEALERLAHRFGQETGVRVRVVADESALAGTARDREVVLLRAAQEALSNVRRHADARNVDLVVTAGDEPGTAGRDGGARTVVRLEVTDDGRGMGPAAVEGFGLRGMRERVTTGGGRLAVTSEVGRGTRVEVSLPSDMDGAEGEP